MGKNKQSNASVKGASKQPATEALPVQQHPIRFKTPTGDELQLKVDRVYNVSNIIMIAGWSSYPCTFTLEVGGVAVTPECIAVPRKDVAEYLSVKDGARLGFALSAVVSASGNIILHASAKELRFAYTFPLQEDAPQDLGPAAAAFGDMLPALLSSLKMHSPEWKGVVSNMLPAHALCPNAAGCLDAAIYNSYTRQVLLMGWLTQWPEAKIWIEDSEGNSWPMDGAFFYWRPDVHKVVGARFGNTGVKAGFLLLLDNAPGVGALNLKTLSNLGVHALSSVEISDIGFDITALARAAFSPPVPAPDFHEVVEKIYEPLFTSCIGQWQAGWKDLPVRVCHLGKKAERPLASIIIPLHGRYDFVEHQLRDFLDDDWLLRHCELIYVVDDPQLWEAFFVRAQILHRLYAIPFTCVWGEINRGFSGANNLGASHAAGETLIFCNSDVFPCSPGWAQVLHETLRSNAKVGAVGARLLRPDGSLQHAGMAFRYLGELGIWVNQHPHAGCDPELDPCVRPSIVPAVTGACLAVRKTDFEAVNGWDTSYLVGDFEDSDLCLKLRRHGLEVLYHPDVHLIHLERQSFKLLGGDEFRQRLTIYNAARHQSRWSDVLNSSPGGSPQIAKTAPKRTRKEVAQ